MTNPLLDGNRGPMGAALAARAGRSSLRIPLSNGLGIGFSGQQGRSTGTATAGPRGNARRGGSGPRSNSTGPSTGLINPNAILRNVGSINAF